MKVLIIEDEAASAKKLKNYLAILDTNIKVMAVLSSIKESIHYLKNHLEPDLIFLDVQLTDGKSFDIFQQVTVNSFVIFVTAYDEHSLQAFDLNTVSYLLKPFDQTDVSRALVKYKQFHQVHEKAKFRERFVVKKGNRFYTFSTQQIAYFIKDQVVYLVSNDGEKFLMESSLEKLEKSLSPVEFFRINRSCLVSYHSIQSYKMESSHRYQLFLNIPGDHSLMVSQSRAADFNHWIKPMK